MINVFTNLHINYIINRYEEINYSLGHSGPAPLVGAGFDWLQRNESCCLSKRGFGCLLCCENAFHEEISWLLAKAFSCKIFGQYANSMESTESVEPSGRKDAIAKKYIKMVQENATQHRDLDFYADQLCITPKYLSHVVSKTTGKKALKWIEDYILVQAMDLLKSSEMTINQVSEQLNFLTQSDFCRFFRKNAGMTPSQYRKKKDVVMTS